MSSDVSSMSALESLATHPTILIVDDDAAIRGLLVEWLRDAGYQCVPASGASEALALIDEHTVDVALLDIRMPGEDGIWLARRLRERHDDLGLIMVTGWQSFDAAVEGMRLGVRDYLLKPFTRRELLDSVLRAVKWRRDSLERRAEAHQLSGAIDDRSRALAQAFADLEVASSSALEALMVTLNVKNPSAFAHAQR